MRIDPKALLLNTLFGRWQPRREFEEGYAVILATPMDMPFLLRYSLEGLTTLDTSHCRQIIVVPDGWGDDGGAGLRQVVAAVDDPGSRWPSWGRSVTVFVPGKNVGTSANSSHWAMIVEGTRRARGEYVFLHDADAFFLEADGLERQYRECLDRGMDTLGVTARWDPFFEEVGYAIPATWELMVSARWACRPQPDRLQGATRRTPPGSIIEFDTMLYPQFVDYPSGKVGLMASPARIVHFNGAVTTYRIFR